MYALKLRVRHGGKFGFASLLCAYALLAAPLQAAEVNSPDDDTSVPIPKAFGELRSIGVSPVYVVKTSGTARAFFVERFPAPLCG